MQVPGHVHARTEHEEHPFVGPEFDVRIDRDDQVGPRAGHVGDRLDGPPACACTGTVDGNEDDLADDDLADEDGVIYTYLGRKTKHKTLFFPECILPIFFGVGSS